MNQREATRPVESTLQKLEHAFRASNASGRSSEVEQGMRDVTEEDERYSNIPCTD